MTIDHDQRDQLATRRAELTTQYLAPRAERPATTARGVHHVALISSDVERTIQFFQGVLGFPLIEMFENRDYEGSTHFFVVPAGVTSLTVEAVGGAGGNGPLLGGLAADVQATLSVTECMTLWW